MTHRSYALAALALTGLVGFFACTSDSAEPAPTGAPDASDVDAATASDGGGDAASADVTTTPLDAADADADAGVIDPWNPPLDVPAVGVSTFDGWETPRLLPPPVNMDGGWTDSVMITADARRLLFAYSTFDFGIVATTGTFVTTAPRRPSMTVDDFRIFQADLAPDRWDVSYHPVNSNDPNLSEASASLNAAQDLLVFSRWAHDAGFTADLFFSSRTSTGWSTPTPLAINTACNDDNAFVVGSLATGLTLYFESDRADDAGTTCGSKKHLFVTKYSGGTFGPVTRAPGLNGADANDEDFQPFVSPDERTAYWTAIRTSPPFYGIFTADRASPNDPFGTPRPVLAVTTFAPPFAGRVIFLGEANVAWVPEGQIMTLMCGTARADDDAGKPASSHLDICYTRRPK